jgi:F1F0 ATPase subunit 2
MRRILMGEALRLIPAAAAGLVLGAIFFGGLWWTVRQAVGARSPGLWFIASQLLRMSIVLTGLWLIGPGNWQRLMACLIGMIVARLIVVHLTRPPAARRAHQTAQVSHAP